MRKLVFLMAASMAVLAATLSVSPAPANAELDAPQRSAWGLSGPATTSNAVDDFEALGWAVEESNGFIFAGGKFQNVTNGKQTVNQANFARFDLQGEWDSSFRPTVERPVLSIATSPDGGLFVAGEVRKYNGDNVGSLTKIDPATGEIWPGWNLKLTGGTNVVREVTVEPDGWAYAVGTFKKVRYNNVPTDVTSIIRFNPVTGEPDLTWLPVVTGGSVWDVSVSRTNNSVYIAGWFTSIAGSDKAAVGIDADDATVVTWGGFENNGSDRVQYGVEATEYGHVWVVGEQHGLWIHDENSNYQIVQQHLTNCHRSMQVNCKRRGGAYQEIERVGDRMYAACHCWGHHATAAGPFVRPYIRDFSEIDERTSYWEVTGSISSLVAYDVKTGKRDQSFNPYLGGRTGGFSIAQASDGCLWSAGDFTKVGALGQQKPGRDLVRLCEGAEALEAPTECSATQSDGSIEVSWPAAAGANKYVVRRSVDDGKQHWRGKVSANSFTDQNRNGDLAYYVEAISSAGKKSSRTLCEFEAEEVPDPQPVAACSADADGGQINVSWNAVDGATKYVAYRSVNGSKQHWRGAANAPAVSMPDTLRDGTVEYFVTAKFGNVTTTRVACSNNI